MRRPTGPATLHASVVRLQALSFARPGERGADRVAELQLVHRDAAGEEQTWCVVSGADDAATLAFAAAFAEATGVPTSRVKPAGEGRWQVEPIGRS